MKKTLLIFVVLSFLSGCISVGEFTPKRHAQHEVGHADCEKTPDRCVNGIPW
ncbi:MAG: hypothetical protein IKK52_01325 [Alphaproteobacteria bacterium]|nr:hypothetical protein [Alphaproteobacteria bacterium]